MPVCTFFMMPPANYAGRTWERLRVKIRQRTGLNIVFVGRLHEFGLEKRTFRRALCRRRPCFAWNWAPVPYGIAMSGAIGANGAISAIGGTFEKVSAAKEAGLTTVILPATMKMTLTWSCLESTLRALFSLCLPF
ncbi:hypothetical protein GPALN_005860 [Globodera pallida]|nr:hypothetical protein GPALN_005860 [Globodera pallida]